MAAIAVAVLAVLVLVVGIIVFKKYATDQGINIFNHEDIFYHKMHYKRIQWFGCNSHDVKPFQFLFLLFFFVATTIQTNKCNIFPVDCKLGEWGSWSSTCSCGGRFLSRRKMVLNSEQYGGRACSDQRELRSCNPTGCNGLDGNFDDKK